MNTYNYLGIQIHRKNPEYVSEFSKTLLEGHYTREGEAIPQALARAATSYCFGDYELAQRIYNYVYDGWFMFASPVLSNATKGYWIYDPEKEGIDKYWYKHYFRPEEKATGLPISCFAFNVPDTAVGQVEAIQELATLSMSGGGTGAHNSIRGTSKKAPGPIPYQKMLDSSIGYFKQGNRRGAIAYYMDVDHPDTIEHIKFRTPGGDSKRRSDNRQQFHTGVNLTDEFIQAVLEDKTYDLKCPHSGKIFETHRARHVFETMIETRAFTGEPFMLKVDLANRRMPETQQKMGLKIRGSNLCARGDTLILTDKGHVPIESVVGQKVNVWNGDQFSAVDILQTSERAELVKVTTNTGQFLECTPFHKFYVVTNYTGGYVEKRAHELRPGDKLVKFDALPVIEGDEVMGLAYQNGFFSGDGCEVMLGDKFLGNRVYLYGEKRLLSDHFRPYARAWGIQEDQDREYGYLDELLPKFTVPNTNYSIASRISWLEGLCDSDGTIARCEGKVISTTLQIASSEVGFLEEVLLMLQTLGVTSKVATMKEAGIQMMPKNDGSGELAPYECRKCQRLLISGAGILALKKLGFTPKRLRLEDREPQRSAERFVKIVSVVNEGVVDKTYCFTEPLRGRGTFNGLLTGQCSEIVLPTDEQRTFVCCLSSLNLERFEDWKDTNIVQDLIRFLDNVLESFIINAPTTLAKAKYSAERERALGLGTFGWHSLLQSKNIAFESGGFGSATQLNHQVFGLIKERCDEASKQLAVERGEAPDMMGTGYRNSRRTAIAPNANSADIAGTSASIEPLYRNVFLKETRAGMVTLKNRYLEAKLETLGINTKKTWDDIQNHEGSVQHLKELTDHDKLVFKTAIEMDQHWLIEQANQRGRYICQAQSLNLYFAADADWDYVLSVHFKFLISRYILTLYYYRTEREAKVDIVKNIERTALVDWNGPECVACQG